MLDGRRILVVVPARGGSKGIPLKNLAVLGGKTLVERAAAVALSLAEVDRAICLTDHDAIARAAIAAGLDVPFREAPQLAGDQVSDRDYLLHALVETEAQDGVRYDVVVMLQPTSPLRRPDQVAAAIAKLVRDGLDAVWTVSRTDSKAHPLKQLTVDGDRITYYDERGAAIVARQQLVPVYHRNGIAYAVTRDSLQRSPTLLGGRTGAVIIDETVVNIDTPWDLELANLVLERAAAR